MATELKSPLDVDLSTSRRSLLLVWQNPASGRFIKVGRLDLLAEGKFAFHYLQSDGADSETLELDDYPERDRVYVSDELPAFFANRVMSSERPSYPQYLAWLGIDESLETMSLPVEVLARTGGSRVTDTFHVLDVPVHLDDRFTSRFFVSGISHTDEAEHVLTTVSSGSELAVRLDEDNPGNSRAVLINTSDGRKIGYVPDWLCADVHDLLVYGWELSVVAERVNLDAPDHVKVLCCIHAVRSKGSRRNYFGCLGRVGLSSGAERTV